MCRPECNPASLILPTVRRGGWSKPNDVAPPAAAKPALVVRAMTREAVVSKFRRDREGDRVERAK